MSLGDILQDQNPWWREPEARRARRYRFRRSLQPEVLSRILRREDRRALVIHGPRQVGKTVLLLQTADDLLEKGWPPANLTYFDFSDDRVTTAVSAREVADARPVGFVTELPHILLLDEISEAEGWDRWLKGTVDTGGLRIAATDSAASLLREESRESGLGRWDEMRLEGLTLPEFVHLQSSPGESAAATFGRLPNLFERYLALGGFPEHVWSEDFPEVRRRLRSDIVDRAIVRDLSRLGVDVERVKNLFVYLVQESGTELNAEARSRDLGADARTVREWVRRLTETLLLTPLERFARQPSAALRARQKIFAGDHGLVSSFSVLASQDDRVRGRVVEAVVFRHLREQSLALGAELSYFRPGEDLEIDFVLAVPGALWGIEVTGSPRVKPDKIKALTRAGEALGTDRILLVYGGALEGTYGAVRTIPLRRFLWDPRAILEETGA